MRIHNVSPCVLLRMLLSELCRVGQEPLSHHGPVACMLLGQCSSSKLHHEEAPRGHSIYRHAKHLYCYVRTSSRLEGQSTCMLKSRTPAAASSLEQFFRKAICGMDSSCSSGKSRASIAMKTGCCCSSLQFASGELAQYLRGARLYRLRCGAYCSTGCTLCAALQGLKHAKAWKMTEGLLLKGCHARVYAMQAQACPETGLSRMSAHLVMPIKVVIAVS